MELRVAIAYFACYVYNNLMVTLRAFLVAFLAALAASHSHARTESTFVFLPTGAQADELRCLMAHALPSREAGGLDYLRAVDSGAAFCVQAEGSRGQFAREHLSRRHGRAATPEEVGSYLAATRAELRERLTRLTNRYCETVGWSRAPAGWAATCRGAIEAKIAERDAARAAQGAGGPWTDYQEGPQQSEP